MTCEDARKLAEIRDYLNDEAEAADDERDETSWRACARFLLSLYDAATARPSAPSKALSLAIACARAYRQAEQDGTPRITRGKALHDLGLALDAALDAVPALEDDILACCRIAGYGARAGAPLRAERSGGGALRQIAKQKLTSEMDDDDRIAGDFEFAYDEMIGTARAALAAIGGAKP